MIISVSCLCTFLCVHVFWLIKSFQSHIYVQYVCVTAGICMLVHM